MCPSSFHIEQKFKNKLKIRHKTNPLLSVSVPFGAIPIGEIWGPVVDSPNPLPKIRFEGIFGIVFTKHRAPPVAKLCSCWQGKGQPFLPSQCHSPAVFLTHGQWVGPLDSFLATLHKDLSELLPRWCGALWRHEGPFGLHASRPLPSCVLQPMLTAVTTKNAQIRSM